jgi:septal ring-binding cell division protein DamX
MGRIATSALALVLGVAAALGLVSCGGSDSSQLLPGDTAKQITTNLDKVEQLAAGHDCAGAQQAAQEVSDQVDALGGVSKKLKQALRDGATRLNSVVANCETTTPEETVAPSIPVETNTSTEAKKKQPSKKTETTTTNTNTAPTTTSTPTTTTPTTTSPTTTPAPPTGGGGTGAPSGGVSPGSPATGSP